MYAFACMCERPSYARVRACVCACVCVRELVCMRMAAYCITIEPVMESSCARLRSFELHAYPICSSVTL